MADYEAAISFAKDMMFNPVLSPSLVKAWSARAVARYNSWRASETGLMGWLSSVLAYGEQGTRFKLSQDRRRAYLFAKDVVEAFEVNSTNETVRKMLYIAVTNALL